jgi:hypothetical protein
LLTITTTMASFEDFVCGTCNLAVNECACTKCPDCDCDPCHCCVDCGIPFCPCGGLADGGPFGDGLVYFTSDGVMVDAAGALVASTTTAGSVADGVTVPTVMPAPATAPASAATSTKKPCVSMVRTGTCSFGDACYFDHDAARISAIQAKVLKVQAAKPWMATKPCRNAPCRSAQCAFHQITPL